MGTEAKTFRTDWIEYGHYDAAAYRIWFRTDGFQGWQRHEWRMNDGTVRVDAWIRTPSTAPSAGFRPVSDAA